MKRLSCLIRKKNQPKKISQTVQPVQNVFNEDHYYQMAIQESLKASNSRNRLHEANNQPEFKLRNEHEIIGLMNVGNTCYFNAIIQVLFQIKDFRSQVLNFNQEAKTQQVK